MIHLRRNLIAIAEVYSQFQGRNNNQEEGLGWEIHVEEMKFMRRKKFLKEEAEDHNSQLRD